MNEEKNCPKCQQENIYFDGSLWICPDCSHEWTSSADLKEDDDHLSSSNVVKDAFGNILADGDDVTLIKELKVKGSTSGLKVGTKVKKIRLIDENDGHNIACKVDGIGSMYLKSEFVKKA